MNRYEVIVKNGRFGRTYHHRDKLRSMGLLYSGTRSKWSGAFAEDSMSMISAIEMYCRKHGLHCEVNDNQYKRNSSYRSDYFLQHKPVRDNRYFCIYCGRLLKQEKVTVDHIIPVARVKKDRHLQEYIKKKGWADENDPANLGASCKSCNSRKGTKMGIWVLRGRIGQSNLFQYCRWVCRIILFALLVAVIIMFLWTDMDSILELFAEWL